MSVQYSDVPAGGIVPVPLGIPGGMLYKVKQLQVDLFKAPQDLEKKRYKVKYHM